MRVNASVVLRVYQMDVSIIAFFHIYLDAYRFSRVRVRNSIQEGCNRILDESEIW